MEKGERDFRFFNILQYHASSEIFETFFSDKKMKVTVPSFLTPPHSVSFFLITEYPVHIRARSKLQ